MNAPLTDNFFKNMKRSPPQWTEPLDEETPPYFSTRRPTAWHEPPQEETTTTERAIFTFLQPKPKIASGSYRESLHRATQFSWTSAMPRFKRNRPESAVTTSALTQQKQRETNRLWIELILSLTTFSSLYISTTSRINIWKLLSKISTVKVYEDIFRFGINFRIGASLLVFIQQEYRYNFSLIFSMNLRKEYPKTKSIAIPY